MTTRSAGTGDTGTGTGSAVRAHLDGGRSDRVVRRPSCALARAVAIGGARRAGRQPSVRSCSQAVADSLRSRSSSLPRVAKTRPTG
ncbi:hypothetical protein K353_03322 [Kitasatospora sp. SolWspMP-SS2h]|nr:hypothetical protein K353_03322 [Kitasatospora sp. SolWspMP-SS2h]